MEQKSPNKKLPEGREQVDVVAESATYVCCFVAMLGTLLSAAIMAGIVYGIVKLVKFLVS